MASKLKKPKKSVKSHFLSRTAEAKKDIFQGRKAPSTN